MGVQTVRRRLRLRSLTPALRDAYDQGRITASVAEAAARLPEAQQPMLLEQLAKRSRLALADTVEASSQQRAADVGELPGELFCERQATWQTTVRGHLIAALRAIPAGADLQAGLASVVTGALARAEKL